jgi:CRP-like cAMP-binding protein
MPETALIRDRVSFLATVPLFAGIPEEELEELGHVMGTIDLSTDDVLFHQGEEADGLHLLEQGRVRVSMRLPGEAEHEFTKLGPGEVLGEIPLIDGGLRMGTARALEPTKALFLSRADFTALVSRLHPTAFTIKRRILRLACERLRATHAALAATLGGGSGNDVAQEHDARWEDLQEGQLHDPAYVVRLPFFRGYGEPELAELLKSCRLISVPAGQQILHEGSMADACSITLNGAVEEMISRRVQVVRLRLCGPGQAFGYVGLIDGRPSSVSINTRERSVLLVCPAGRFEALFHGDTIDSYAFFHGIERDLMTALRQAQAPQARLAAAQ